METTSDVDLVEASNFCLWEDDRIGSLCIFEMAAQIELDFNEQQERFIISGVERLLEEKGHEERDQVCQDSQALICLGDQSQGADRRRVEEEGNTPATGPTQAEERVDSDNGPGSDNVIGCDKESQDGEDGQRGIASQKSMGCDDGQQSGDNEGDFDELFNCMTPFFREGDCLENLNVIFELITCPRRSVRQELVNRFPRKLYGHASEKALSEVQRCLYHLPSTIVDVVLNKLMSLVLGSPSFESESLFYFIRFLDVYAFEARYPDVFFQRAALVQKIGVFNKVFGRFFAIFQKYRKIRDIMPSYRLKKKGDIRLNLVQYAVARESYDDICSLEFHIHKEDMQSEIEVACFFKNTTLLYYILTFFYNRYDRLLEVYKNDYLRVIFNDCE